MVKERQIHIGSRLKLLRIRANMSQVEFCKNFSIFSGMTNILPVTTLSSYECDLKRPSYEMLCAFSDFFNVSIEYLIGISDSEFTGKKQVNKQNLFLDDFILEIPQSDLKKYNNKPVYIIYKDDNNIKYGAWGIYNLAENYFRCASETITNSEKLKFYAITPDMCPSPRRIVKKRRTKKEMAAANA